MTKHKLKTTICAISVATLSISLATASFAQSRQNQQGANALGDLIGMIANASAKSDAKKKWAKVSPEIQQCVNTTFSSKNVNVDQIVAAGMSPNAKDIAPVIELCQTVMTAQLKTDFPCNVPDSKGVQVPTTCVQSYAKAVNGKWAPVSRDDFLRAVGNDDKVNVGDFETAAAQNARLAEEKRLAQEAAVKKEAARRERLAKQEEDRRRFAATPEGKRQAAERAAAARAAAAEKARRDLARAEAQKTSQAAEVACDKGVQSKYNGYHVTSIGRTYSEFFEKIYGKNIFFRYSIDSPSVNVDGIIVICVYSPSSKSVLRISREDRAG